MQAHAAQAASRISGGDQTVRQPTPCNNSIRHVVQFRKRKNICGALVIEFVSALVQPLTSLKPSTRLVEDWMRQGPGQVNTTSFPVSPMRRGAKSPTDL